MRYVNSSYEKALTYLLRYVNVLKKTMRKTLITSVFSMYLLYFSPDPEFWIFPMLGGPVFR